MKQRKEIAWREREVKSVCSGSLKEFKLLNIGMDTKQMEEIVA